MDNKTREQVIDYVYNTYPETSEKGKANICMQVWEKQQSTALLDKLTKEDINSIAQTLLDETGEIGFRNGVIIGIEKFKQTLRPVQDVCEECKRREATTKYSNMKVCETCSTKLNDYFDEEYR